MKFLTFAYHGKQYPAVLSPDGARAVPLEELGFSAPTLEAFIVSGAVRSLDPRKLEAASGFDLRSVTLLAPIPEPLQEVLVMENNFAASPEDLAAYRQAHPDGLPTYFYKKASVCNTDGAPIPSYPGHVTELDYQAELCAVIGQDAYKVRPGDARHYIFGYTVINNVIARNLTVKHRRPYIATSLDGFLPICPYIVTPDEAPEEITVRSYVNGELRQEAPTSLAKYDFAYAIADLSQMSILRAGSILTLGTPFGTGADQQPPRWLRPGDTVTCEASGVGSVTNTIR